MNAFKFNRMELAGAMGDIGTLFPLAIALITINGLNPTSVFLVTGLAYIGAGLYYRIPIPVQPLKAVAAIAIASKTGPETIACAGLWMAVILPILSHKKVANFLQVLFTQPIIRGIQLGVGLMLIKRGVMLIVGEKIFADEGNSLIGLSGSNLPIGILIALISGMLLFFLRKNKKFPATIIIILFAMIVGATKSTSVPMSFGPSPIRFYLPSVEILWTALFLLVIPQLPLTIGNAIAATNETAHLYFGQKAEKVSQRSLPLSMAAANFLAGISMGMPVCHGSGGLTAHYRFGAKTGGASIIMGSICLLLALLFGKTAVSILSAVPLPILGVLMAYVGVCHAILIRDLTLREEFCLALVIGVVGVVSRNLALGFGLGIAFNLVFRFKTVFQ